MKKNFTGLMPVIVLLMTIISFLVPARVLAANDCPDCTDAGGGGGIVEYNEYKTDTKAGVEGDVNSAYHVGSTLKWVQTGFIDYLVGQDGNGLASSFTKYIAMMYEEKPASTERYVAYVLNEAHFVPQAYAQGLGFSALSPVLDAWRTFRNVAYFFFVLLFLVIGFMIMFRYRIGQTAITAQQAIPRVIVALLAVTFSYAIAGLLIDVMYLVMFLLIGVFGVDQNAFLTTGPIQLGSKLVSAGFSDGSTLAAHIVEMLLGDGVVGNVLGAISGLSAGVVVAIAIAIGVFRLFFSLLRTYVSLLVSITLSPLILMMGAIPGRNTFTPWVKSLIGNLSAFPIVLLFLIIFDKITGGISQASPIIQNGGFTPPYLFGVSGAGIIPFALGLGGLLVLEKIVEDGKKMMGAKGGIFEQYASALSDSVKRGWTGGELIPGVGFTNTSKYGLSGKSLTKTGAVAGAGLAAIPGAGLNWAGTAIRTQGSTAASSEAFKGNIRAAMRVAADASGSSIMKADREKRKKISWVDFARKRQAYRQEK